MKMPFPKKIILVLIVLFKYGIIDSVSAQPLDDIAARSIQEATTDGRFITDWVAQLPEHETIPSPRDVLGYTIGTPAKLTHVDDIHRYFHILADASPRVKVFSLGLSFENREMVIVAIADEKTIDSLETYRQFTHQLADPRSITEQKADEIIKQAKPIYWITAGLHSAELGPPEMTMELAYRLAVDERQIFETIRSQVIVLITPVLEVDGRARQVEWYDRHIKGYTDYDDMPPKSPPFWGHYIRHDNNRDGLTFSQPLTQNYVNGFFHWTPTMSLDLHESVPLLYASTGTGPYNTAVDPITITEWQTIASYEVARLTARGFPGVWTWGYYTGWFPGYLLWVTNNHNANGRFYETFGNATARTLERDVRNATFAGKKITEKTWYRSMPPEKKFMWSMRNNTNIMQSGVIASMEMVAKNAEVFLRNFYQKGVNAIDRAVEEAPYAFVIPAKQTDLNGAADLVRILQMHRIEVLRADKNFKLTEDEKIRKGDLIVKLNQPYGPLAKNLLDKQEFPEKVQVPPYDDVAWTLGLQMGVQVIGVDNRDILALKTSPLDDAGMFQPDPVRGSKRYVIINHQGQNELGPLRFALSSYRIYAANEAFALGKNEFEAGSFIIDSQSDGHEMIKQELKKRSLNAASRSRLPDVPMHELDVPRIGLLHSWVSTQNAGWLRFSLDNDKVPYTLLSKDRLRKGDLQKDFDLVIVPAFSANTTLATIIRGIDDKWSPLAYTRTESYPSHGIIDSSNDITGGFGFKGMEALYQFVKAGGTLICLHSGGIVATSSGITPDITTSRPAGLNTPGSILTVKVLKPHPLTWGYDKWTHVFRNNGPLFRVADHNRHMALMQFGSKQIPEPDEPEKKDEKTEGKEKTPPIVKSGAILGGKTIIDGAPALLHCRVGKGNVVLFAWNPMHRNINHHDHAFFYNAVLNWNDLPEPVKQKNETPVQVQ